MNKQWRLYYLDSSFCYSQFSDPVLGFETKKKKKMNRSSYQFNKILPIPVSLETPPINTHTHTHTHTHAFMLFCFKFSTLRFRQMLSATTPLLQSPSSSANVQLQIFIHLSQMIKALPKDTNVQNSLGGLLSKFSSLVSGEFRLPSSLVLGTTLATRSAELFT